MSAKETHMEIRHLYNLRNSLSLAWFLPLTIFCFILLFLYKEILFFSLENILRDMIPSAFVFITGAMIIFFIYNEVMLKPLFMRCRSGIHNYRFKHYVIHSLCRDILWCIIINLIFFGAVYLAYPSEISELGWRIFTEFKTMFLTLVICDSVMLLGQPPFLYLWEAGANYIEKDKFEDWLETDFPSFPIKSALVAFSLFAAGAFFIHAYIHLFINPGLLNPTLVISAASISLALLPLYYYLIKRIVNRFIERHELI